MKPITYYIVFFFTYFNDKMTRQGCGNMYGENKNQRNALKHPSWGRCLQMLLDDALYTYIKTGKKRGKPKQTNHTNKTHQINNRTSGLNRFANHAQ